MMEADITAILLNNGVGVVFGILMYRMANTTIKDNTTAVHMLIDELRRGRLNRGNYDGTERR